MKRNGRGNVVLTKKASSPQATDAWTTKDQAALDEVNAIRAGEELPPMSRDEYLDYSDAGNPPDTQTKAEKLAEHNAWRAEKGLKDRTEAEYDAWVASTPKFDWASLRERLLEGGSNEDDELVQLCREHEAIDGGPTRGVRQ